MRKRYRITFVVIICLAFFQIGYCQKKISFGKVTLEELQMTSYKEDSTAGAVILSDVGAFNGTTLQFSRLIRVKILNKSGLDWGNWVFNTPSKGDFKVLVFNLVGGQVVRDKADNNTIYSEEVVNGNEVYKVFAPNVSVGSVIDIAFSHLGMPSEWRFQERIPVIYSELTIERSMNVTYSKTHFGFEPIQTISPEEWKAHNMPAFKMEPYLSSYSNYITKFEFQVETFGVKGNLFYLEYSTSWSRIIDLLTGYSRFGGVVNGSLFLNDFARETKAKKISTEEKIAEAFSFVQRNIKWNGVKSVISSVAPRSNFLSDHSGNSADINLILISLLNKMGITTYPVALSTRDNGFLFQHAPTISKLNYVVGYVQHAGLEMFVDATSENLFPGILPAYCLNGEGLVMRPADQPQWLSLLGSHKELKKQFITINISDDGSAKAIVKQEFRGYGFLNWADALKVNNDDTERQKNTLQAAYPDIDILTYEITGKDIQTAMAKEVIEVDVTSQLVDSGDGMIFTPFVMFDYAKNLLKTEDRKYPVDLLCPKDLNTIILVQLPTGYGVKSLPASVKLSNPDGSATFAYIASVNATGAGLQFKTILKLDKHIFTETEYLDLRQFFSEVSKKIGAPLELVKK